MYKVYFKVFTNKKIWLLTCHFFFQYLFIVELAKIRGNWMFWNVINCLLAFIWFPCFGITMFLENDWPLVMILTFFVIIGVNRAILSVGMWKLKVHEVNPRAVPEPGLQQQPVVMVKKLLKVYIFKCCDYIWYIKLFFGFLKVESSAARFLDVIVVGAE